MNNSTQQQLGKFIVFEGIDGAGVSTQSRLLIKHLQEVRHQQCFSTSEPSNGPIGSMLRLFLSKRLILNNNQNIETNKLANGSLALLFAADRLDHIQYAVQPKLQQGIHVICERYYLSSYAYQTLDDRNNLAWLRSINARALRPSLTVFVNTSLAVAEKRRQARDPYHQDIFEKSELLAKVAANYQYAMEILKNEEQLEVVDGNLSENAVAGEVLRVVQRTLPELF